MFICYGNPANALALRLRGAQKVQRKMKKTSYDLASRVAKIIGQCDFRVALSRYMGRDNSPWIITVGESNWRRHLVLNEGCASKSREEIALLEILSQEESEKFMLDIRSDNIVGHIMLFDLVSNGYLGVKKALYPRKA